MAGLFDTLGIATRGLQVVQRGLATTAHNIANVDTPGFSRQRSVLQAGPPQADSSGSIGSGVEQVTVERIIDRFIGFRLISETSRRASLDTENAIYRDVESLVNEQFAGGLSSELSGFYDSLDDLSNSIESGQAVARGQVLATAESFVDTVHRIDSRLRGLQRDADRGITGLLRDINAITAGIAELNGQIAEADTISPANDLRDRRDQLVLELAEKIEIVTFENANGSFSIRIGGGLSLVDGRVAAELVAVVDPSNPNAFDPTFSQVFYRGSGSFFDATSSLGGGELGGLLDARDGIIAGAIRDLDAIVFTLTDSFNSVHRGGFGLDDDVAHDFFTDLSAQATVDDSARNFGISADIDPNQSGGSINNIAVGRVSMGAGLGALPGDTDFVEDLKDLRLSSVSNHYLAGDAVGTPTGAPISVTGSLINFSSVIGQNARSTLRALEQQEAVLSAVQDRRDSISGVSIDEEVAELVKLQASFQANARVVSVVNLLLQELFDAL